MARLLVFLLLISFSVVSVFATGAAARDWDCDPVAWRQDGEAFAGDNAGWALAPAPRARRVTIRARVTPELSRIPEYGSIGVGVFDDLDRFWRMAVLKGPESMGSWHRYELKAMGDGNWGAEATSMRRTTNRRSSEWRWGSPVDLSLSFSPERVEGVATDPETGAELYRCVFEINDGAAPPVPAGRPALFTADDFRGRVENVAWTVEDEVHGAPRQFPKYRPVGPETGIRGAATGFFHMESIDGRDWAIDPLGRATVLAGTDWCNLRGTMCEKLGYSPYGRWVKEHYASDVEWAAETAERLVSWGFTFLPCGGDVSLRYRDLAWANAADRVYFSHRMCRGDPDWRICTYRPAPCTAFPNVFHPDFEAACDWWARHRCAPYRDDPWLVGYFIDNELAWWGDVNANKAGGLFDAVAKKPDTHPAKKALLEYLATSGGAGEEAPHPLAEATPEQKIGFLRLAAERYFAATTAAIRRADPNHMILGCRFAGGPKGVHPVVMEVAGKYCDVVSFNHYPWADLDQGVVFNSRADQTPVAELYQESHGLAGRPFLLTEWSFPALDTGRPCFHGAGQRFRTQAERVQASELYARTLLSLPFFAGYSFFRWLDQPALGIRKTFPEDSNYGLVSEEGVPYEGLTRMFARVHGAAAQIRAAGFAGADPAAPPVASGQQQESERGRYWAAAAKTASGQQQESERASCIVHYALSPDGAWRLSNGLVSLSGRVGGKFMADEIAFAPDGKAATEPVGRWGALLQWDNGGSPVWTEISRVTDVTPATDEATGIVSLEIRAEGGDFADAGDGAALTADAKSKARFAITHRISLAPEAGEVLAETVSLENIGEAPFTMQLLMMRPFAIERQPVETETVPNLWKGPVESYWGLSDGSRFGVASTDPGVLGARLWRKDGETAQHPDVRCSEGAPVTLAPGETYRPAISMAARIRHQLPRNTTDQP